MGRAGTRRVLLVASVALLSACAGWEVADANGPEVITTGACMVPVRKSRVQLVREDVMLTPPRGGQLDGRVECSYVLRNPEQRSVNLTMAFVVGREGRLEAVHGNDDSKFKVLQMGAKGGVELPVHLRAIAPSAWEPYVRDVAELPCWDVSIPAGGETVLRMSYNVWWDFLDAGTDHSRTVLVYHAKAARLWAGPIELAKFRIDLDHVAGRFWRCAFDSSGWGLGRVSPGGYRETDFGVQWTFRDWTPDTDFTVTLADQCGPSGRDKAGPR